MTWKKALVIAGVGYAIFTIGYVCGGVHGWWMGEQYIINQLRRQGFVC